MARAPQVTRTIQTTHCTVLCMDIENCEPCNKEVILPRTYKDDKDMLKAAKKAIETDTLKPVQIVDSMVQETLYGMSEQDFISHATILPPRKVCPIESVCIQSDTPKPCPLDRFNDELEDLPDITN